MAAELEICAIWDERSEFQAFLLIFNPWIQTYYLFFPGSILSYFFSNEMSVLVQRWILILVRPQNFFYREKYSWFLSYNSQSVYIPKKSPIYFCLCCFASLLYVCVASLTTTKAKSHFEWLTRWALGSCNIEYCVFFLIRTSSSSRSQASMFRASRKGAIFGSLEECISFVAVDHGIFVLYTIKSKNI